MTAVILAGGLGTRLRPYTTVIPKPLVPIGERPVLEHIIRSLARCGTNRIDLCVEVSMGIDVYALEYLPEDGPCQFPDLVLRLIKAREHVAAYECDADWFDIVHEHERAVVDIEQFPEKYDVEAPLLDPHDVSGTFE
jgi:NDP-sugar pyrophosphorylase family protein